MSEDTGGGTFDFDVALSFANEDRGYVAELAGILQDRGVRLFYDEFFRSQTWGADLGEYLDDVYRKKARFTVAFISRSYVIKPWTRHERRSALARAFNESGPYFLPVRLDDADVPGLSPMVAYVDARITSPSQLADLVLERLGKSVSVGPARVPRLGVPRTEDQQKRLLAQRPNGWEYFFFAGVLLHGKAALEPKWRDHELGYRRVTRWVNDAEAVEYVLTELRKFMTYGENFGNILSRDAQAAAFGPPGTEGDPEQIEHLARRLVGVYGDFLDWAARVRGTGTSERLTRLFRLAAAHADTPAREMRAFFDRYAVEMDGLSERIAAGEPIYLPLTFALTVDDRTSKEFHRELKRARRRVRS